MAIYFALNAQITLLMEITSAKLNKNISGTANFVTKRYKNLSDNGQKCPKFMTRSMHKKLMMKI